LLDGFHRLSGTADLTFGDAIDELRAAGQTVLADELAVDLQGRNVIPGRWTFQLVEEYDDGYYSRFRAHEQRARDQLLGGRRHLYEAEMKQREITPGRPGHEASPADLDWSVAT